MPIAQRTASTGTGELDQNAVPRGLYNTAAMFGDLRVKKELAQSFERTQGALLVNTHQTAVADDVSREDCCRRSTRVSAIRLALTAP